MKKEDRKTKKKESCEQVLTVVIYAVAGWFAGYFGGTFLKTSGNMGRDILYFVIGLFIAFYLQIILHEAGHLFFGLLTGYRFISFRIGNLTLYRKQGKLYFGKYSLAGTGGQCLMAPPDMQNGKMPYQLYNFGGALMNLIISGIAVVLYFVFDLGSLMTYTCMMTAFVGVFVAFTNGVPMRIGGVDNDGYNALSLGKDPEALRGFWIQLKVIEMLTEGRRLKEMPKEWFEKPSDEDMKNNMIAAVEALRCNRLLDAMEFERANQEIGEVATGKNGMEGLQKMLLQIDQVFCEIFGERREEILKQMKDKKLVKFMKSMKAFPSVVRTRYAYALLIEKDEKKAAKFRKQFEKMMKNYPYEGEVKSEWELIRHCEQSFMS